jgi:hypothetical protein
MTLRKTPSGWSHEAANRHLAASLVRSATGDVVTETTAMGVASSYELDDLLSGDVHQIVNGPDGLTTTTVRRANVGPTTMCTRPTWPAVDGIGRA